MVQKFIFSNTLNISIQEEQSQRC